MTTKREYAEIEDPYDIDLENEEVTSHSSLLTNRRLDLMFMKLDEIRIDAYSNKCVPNIESFHAVLTGIYNNVFPLFEDKENEMIKQHLDLYEQYYQLFFAEDPNVFAICLVLLKILDYLQKLVIGFMQKRKFFFRTEVKGIKGIDEALRMYALNPKKKDLRPLKKENKEKEPVKEEVPVEEEAPVPEEDETFIDEQPGGLSDIHVKGSG
jgi:hypothetical protein